MRFFSLFFLLSFIGYSNIEAATSARVKTCEDFLAQYNPALSGAQGIATTQLSTPKRLLSPLAGTSSKTIYIPEWTVKTSKEGRAYLDFGFRVEGQTDKKKAFAVVATPAEKDASKIGLTYRLPEDQDHNVKEWGLLTRALEHLFTFAEPEDRISFTVYDTATRAVLLNEITIMLEEIYYTGPRPEAVMVSDNDFDAGSDLKIEDLTYMNFKELMDRLTMEGLDKRLTKVFADSPLGKALLATGNWTPKISLVSFLLNEPKNEDEEASYLGPYQLLFRVELAPNW